jgi:hypothetical protein
MLIKGRFKLLYGMLSEDRRLAFWGEPWNGPAFGRPVTLPPDRVGLFDLVDDPGESCNLVDDPAFADVLAELKEALLQRLIANSQSVEDDPGSVL